MVHSRQATPKKGGGGVLLAVDVGNTNVVLGVFRDGELVAHFRLGSDRSRTAHEYGVFVRSLFSAAHLSPQQVGRVAIASVVPPLTGVLAETTRDVFGVEPLILAPGMDLGLTVRVDVPWEVGIDRLANAVAAREKVGAPAIVVDFGTATTVDVVDADGAYAGGLIAPGMVTAAEALFQRAAKLPRVELVRPARAIGKSTVEAMQAGIVLGFAGQVDALVRRVRAELGSPQAPVLATGGLASLVVGEAQTPMQVEPFLTLYGIRSMVEHHLAAGRGGTGAAGRAGGTHHLP
jgi:type III pantothenate kinase